MAIDWGPRRVSSKEELLQGSKDRVQKSIDKRLGRYKKKENAPVTTPKNDEKTQTPGQIPWPSVSPDDRLIPEGTAPNLAADMLDSIIYSEPARAVESFQTLMQQRANEMVMDRFFSARSNAVEEEPVGRNRDRGR